MLSIMMKRHLLFTLCLLLAVHAKADPISVEQARQKAAQFLQGQVKTGSRRRAPAAKELRMVAKGRADTYYVFNAANRGDGYVVVSGDDATESILGYSHTGTIDPENMPCGMHALLDTYAQQIQYLRENVITRKQNTLAPKAVTREHHIDKDLLARFGQGNPYNRLCPEIDKKNCKTGCAATAMAQLMYYYKWPYRTNSTIPGYVDGNLTIDPILENSAIDWVNILKQYNSQGTLFNHELWDTDEQADAIANLMKMAGVSVRMHYGTEVSYAPNYNIIYALKKYFGYESANLKRRSAFTDEQWNIMLCNELDNNKPIIYDGGIGNDGHFFILEGYQYVDDYYYDINFGWDDQNNGQFLLTIKKDAFTFTEEQSAIFDVTPSNTLAPVDIPLRLSMDDIRAYTKDVYCRSSETNAFNDIILFFHLANASPVDAEFNYGFLFKNENEDVVDNYYYDDILQVSGNFIGKDFGVSIDRKGFSGKNLTDGKYTIQAISKETRSDIWLLDDYSAKDYNKYINAVVCGDKLSLQFTEPSATVSLADFIQTSDVPLRVGQPSEFSVSVNNAYSSENYKGGILIKEAKSGKVIHIDEVDLVGDTPGQFTFSYTPTTDGELRLLVLNKRWETIGWLNTNVASANGSLNMLEMTNLRIEDYDEGRHILDNTILNGAITLFNHDVVTHSRLVYVTLTEVETDKTKERPMIVSIPPNEHVTYNFKFSNLVEGHHYVFEAKYYLGGEIYHSEPFLCTNDESNDENIAGNERLRSFEYWFDDDFSDRNTISLGTRKAVVRTSIDTDDLDDGFHTLYYRVQRDDDSFSAVSRSTFLKLTREHEGFFDYWIDDDEDNKQRIALEDTEDEQLLTLDLSDNEQVPVGYHKLKYQVAVPGSIVSPVQTQGILKLSTGNATTLEYWYDDDFAGRQRLTEHTIESGGYVYASQLDMSHLPVGVHRLNMRAVSPSGITNGSVLTCRVVKMSNSVASKIEYWYDDDMANSQILDGQINEGGYLFASQLDMSSLPVGLHKLNFRAVAANGFNPSPIVSCTVMKLPHGKVSQFEYWFDGDYAHSQIINLNNTNTNECLFANELNLSGIAPGHHRLYYRAIGPNSQISTAVGTAAIMVGALSRATEGAAVLASYSIEVDDVKVVANGKMNGRNVQDFRYILDASGLSIGSHMLKASFWNSYGVGVTEQVPFSVIEWPTYIRGDVNDDGHVTITDAVAVVNYILGNISDVFAFKAADINGDGKITITDAVEIANIILNK